MHVVQAICQLSLASSDSASVFPFARVVIFSGYGVGRSSANGGGSVLELACGVVVADYLLWLFSRIGITATRSQLLLDAYTVLGQLLALL